MSRVGIMNIRRHNIGIMHLLEVLIKGSKNISTVGIAIHRGLNPDKIVRGQIGQIISQ